MLDIFAKKYYITASYMKHFEISRLVFFTGYTHVNMEFIFVYDVIMVHQVAGSPDYDVVMTE